MDDDEFLSYCNGMALTPRCGFVPAQVARLVRLSGGEERIALAWEARHPHEIHDMDQDTIREAVRKARKLIAAKAA